MDTKVKALRSKPMVGIGVAVGSIEMRADSLVDAAMLQALYEMLIHGKHDALGEAWAEAAKTVAARWKDGPDFEMVPRKSRVAS